MAWGRPLGTFFSHLGALSATYSPERRNGVGEGRMVKETRLDWSPWSLHNHYTCAKFLVCILLIGLSLRLLLSSSWGFCPFPEHAAKPPKAERPADVGGGELFRETPPFPPSLAADSRPFRGETDTLDLVFSWISGLVLDNHLFRFRTW